jgi:hypothetical protein
MLYDFFHGIGQATAAAVSWYFRQSDWVQILGLFAAIVVVVWWSLRTADREPA